MLYCDNNPGADGPDDGDDRGADALRWNFAFASSPWTPKRVYLENIDETTNRFLVTLWNTYSFFVTYANAEGFDLDAVARPGLHISKELLLVLGIIVGQFVDRGVEVQEAALDLLDQVLAARQGGKPRHNTPTSTDK